MANRKNNFLKVFIDLSSSPSFSGLRPFKERAKSTVKVNWLLKRVENAFKGFSPLGEEKEQLFKFFY